MATLYEIGLTSIVQRPEWHPWRHPWACSVHENVALL